jgi:DNA polymerase III gamma/tau subunit
MLGTLDDDQALSLIEAMIAADGERVMALVNAAAARGVEWEALLVEMLSLLHRVAMVQLSPSAWARIWPPLNSGCVNLRAPCRLPTCSCTTRRC